MYDLAVRLCPEIAVLMTNARMMVRWVARKGIGRGGHTASVLIIVENVTDGDWYVSEETRVCALEMSLTKDLNVFYGRFSSGSTKVWIRKGQESESKNVGSRCTYYMIAATQEFSRSY